MKKEGLFTSLALLLISILIIVGCTAPAAAPGTTVPTTAPAKPVEAIKLILASWNPPQAATSLNEARWAKELEQRTGNRIKVTLNQGASMGSPGEHYNLAFKGIADVSHVGVSQIPGVMPMVEVVAYPTAGSAGPSEVAYARAMWELYKMGYFDSDFRDVKFLGIACNGPYDFQTTSKVIRGFSDLAGMKIRVSGAQHTELIKAMGGTPVAMPITELFDAMQKGVVDGNFTNWGAIEPFGILPIVKHFTEVGVGWGSHALVMNKNYWTKLPDDIKAIIDSMSEEWCVIGGVEFAKENERVKDKYKGAVYQFAAADIAQMDNVMAPIWQKWIAEGEAKGQPRAKIVKDLYNLLKKFGIGKPMYGFTP